MHWRRTAPVQAVDALFAAGADAADRLLAGLAGKSALFGALPMARGDDWIILFAGPIPGDVADPPGRILPSLAGMVPLYEEAKGWWLPVGIELAVPVQARDAVRAALCEEHGVMPPALIVPRFDAGAETTRAIDLYLIGAPGGEAR